VLYRNRRMQLKRRGRLELVLNVNRIEYLKYKCDRKNRCELGKCAWRALMKGSRPVGRSDAHLFYKLQVPTLLGT
jgi:hypothetical protein